MILKGKKVALLGWGINGLDASKYLLKKGAKVTIFDKKEKRDIDFFGFDIEKIKYFFGKDYLKGG